jgi:hypothetical protein
MKTTKSILIVMLITTFSVASYAQTKNFSGKWNLNKEKSDFGNMSPNSAPIQIEIAQDKKQVWVERKQLYPSGDSTVYTEKMTFNGKPSETSIKAGLTKIATIKWPDDKSKLLDEATYFNGQKSKGSWVLSNEGKTLTLPRETTVDGQTVQTTYVYQKQ